MTKKRIVVALGGNAILSQDASAQAQQKALRKTAAYLAKFIQNGDELVVSHGNGPQVGNLLLQQAAGSTKSNPAMPLDTAVAMTQGSIGYWLQNALNEEMAKIGLEGEAVTIVTRVEVDGNDPAFQRPSKPIGPFYTQKIAEDKRREHTGYRFAEDAGRGYRRVVPSPMPINILEANVVRTLVNNGIVPIAAGGGGVPVIYNGNQLEGQEAVIDKDFASEKLAEQINADLLIILTAVDYVFVNFNKPNQKALESVTVKELQKYLEEGQFAEGSMLPKVQAAMNFVEHTHNARAVITSLENIDGFLEYGKGTVITENRANVK